MTMQKQNSFSVVKNLVRITNHHFHVTNFVIKGDNSRSPAIAFINLFIQEYPIQAKEKV
jgi:hypothetical protein